MEIPRISPRQVTQRVERGERVVFVDARSQKAYVEATEQIPGSLRVAPDDAQPALGDLARDATVVTYCT